MCSDISDDSGSLIFIIQLLDILLSAHRMLSKLIVNFNILVSEKEISCLLHKEGSESRIDQFYVNNLISSYS